MPDKLKFMSNCLTLVIHLEGYNFLIVVVFTLPIIYHFFLLSLWSPKGQGDFTRWCHLGCLWTIHATPFIDKYVDHVIGTSNRVEHIWQCPCNKISSDVIHMFMKVWS